MWFDQRTMMRASIHATCASILVTRAHLQQEQYSRTERPLYCAIYCAPPSLPLWLWWLPVICALSSLPSVPLIHPHFLHALTTVQFS